MPISGSCDGAQSACDRLVSAKAQQAAERLPLSPGQKADPEQLRSVARDFASLLYTTLIQQMQKTVREESEDDEPLREGVEGFVSMFLPQAVAGNSQDPLSKYIYEHLSARYGDRVDEQA